MNLHFKFVISTIKVPRVFSKATLKRNLKKNKPGRAAHLMATSLCKTSEVSTYFSYAEPTPDRKLAASNNTRFFFIYSVLIRDWLYGTNNTIISRLGSPTYSIITAVTRHLRQILIKCENVFV